MTPGADRDTQVPGTEDISPQTSFVFADTAVTEGRTPREIKRCLKRYLARDLYRLLETQPKPLDNP